MKKITLLLLLSLSALSLQAQNKYELTTLQQTYTDLDSPVSINNGVAWDWDTFDEVAIPFEFKISGQTVNRFLFDDDYFAFISPDGDFETEEGVTNIFPSMAFIQDRTYNTGTSTSPLSYKFEGTEGSRILKLEIKNVGSELSVEKGFSEDHFYMNFQIWLYEADNVIELRYGDNNIANISDIYPEEDVDFIFLAGIEDPEANIIVLSGQSTNPTYQEINEQNAPDTISSDSFPATGTVYRLTPEATAGIVDFSVSSFKLYPNPASSVLNIQSESLTASEYAIYNVLGKLVAHTTIADSNNIQVNVSGLESGLYFVKINNQYLKFIKQ